MRMTSRFERTEVAQRNPSGRVASLVSQATTVVLLLGLAVAAATVFLLALGLLPASAVVAAFAPVGELLGKVGTLEMVDRALVGAAAGLLGVAALALAVRTPRDVPLVASKHVLQADEKGLVVIGSASVETIAVQTAVLSPGVLDAQVTVRGRPSGPVRLQIRIDVLPGTDVKRLGPRVQDAVRRSVEDLVGLSVRDANIEVRVMDPDELVGAL
jgi:hypothetical protein